MPASLVAAENVGFEPIKCLEKDTSSRITMRGDTNSVVDFDSFFIKTKVSGIYFFILEIGA